jgi:hypothetical protein
MPSAALSGEVQQWVPGDGIRWGMWRTVLTASGIPVVDNWKMPRDWRDDIDAARYAFKVPYTPGPVGAVMQPNFGKLGKGLYLR